MNEKKGIADDISALCATLQMNAIDGATFEDLVFVMNPRPIVGVSEDGAFVIGD